MRAAIALALGVAIGCGGGGRGAPDGGGADGGGGDVPATIVCNLPLTTRALTVPRSEVAGVLVGPSRNDSTGCTGDRKTGGPEAMYTLDLAERSLLELEVISNLDTVIAVRRACHDPLSELACNDNPGADVPAVPPDAGPGDAGVAANRDGRLRVVLDPGSYFVLVDEAAAFGVGGDFVLRASVTPPPLQTSCETALPIMDGTVLEAQELDVGPPAQLCAGGGSGRALYYRANIPAGHRLTARAAGRLGLMSWKPTLQVLTACGTGVCAGTPEPGYDVDRVLRFENTGLGPASVVLAVSSNEPVPGGSFRLSARIRQFPTNTTCETAQALSDGLVLRNQYLLEGQSLFGDLCNPPRATPSLFYKAMLVPGQTVRLELHGRTDESPGPLPLLAHVVEQCEALRCPGQGANTVEFKNDTQVRKTVIFEVAGHPALTATVFDLTARMPLPAGGVEVKAVNQVVTTEAGGKASFTVVLATPPIEPVELSLASSDLGEGLVEPTTMTFFPDTWDRPQIVTVTGVDDAFPDGTQSYRLHIGPAASRDSRFQGLVVPEVALINRDDEPGFHVERPPSLLTSERGAATRFTVVMNRAPAAAVRLPLASSDEGEGRVSPAELVFDPATWSIPQSVTVTGVDDADDDGKQRYKVQLAPSISAEPLHAGIDPPDLDVENGDDDFSSVAARLVTGNRFCYAGTSIGVDHFGLLYLVTTCDRQVDVRGDPIALVFTSADGGLSWSDPVEPGLTQGGAIAGATPNRAVLAGYREGRVAMSRTEDGGRTWRTSEPVPGPVTELRLVSSGSRLALSRPDDVDTLWISSDEGQSFVKRTLGVNLRNVRAWLDPGDLALTVAGEGGPIEFVRSTDNGVSFGKGQQVTSNDFNHHAFAVGPRSLFISGAQGQLLVAPLDDVAGARRVSGFPSFEQSGTYQLLVDPADNLVVLTRGSSGGEVQIRRLPSGASALGEPVTLGPESWGLDGVALSDRAVAVAVYRDDKVYVAVQRWP
jgi:hypothetical protein